MWSMRRSTQVRFGAFLAPPIVLSFLLFWPIERWPTQLPSVRSLFDFLRVGLCGVCCCISGLSGDPDTLTVELWDALGVDIDFIIYNGLDT